MHGCVVSGLARKKMVAPLLKIPLLLGGFVCTSNAGRLQACLGGAAGIQLHGDADSFSMHVAADTATSSLVDLHESGGLRRKMLAILLLARNGYAFRPCTRGFLLARNMGYPRGGPSVNSIKSWPIVLRRRAPCVARAVSENSEDDTLAKLDRLRLRLEIAKREMERQPSVPASQNLKAAEDAISAYEMENPIASIENVLTRKVVAAREVGDMASEQEAWELEKLGEEKRKLDEADATLDAAKATNETQTNATVPWQKIAGATAERGYWTLRGSSRAEVDLLQQIKDFEGTWIAREADSVLRKSWGTSFNQAAISTLDAARASLVAGDATKALSFYDKLCADISPEWPEAWYRRGLCLQRALRDNDSAELSFETSLRLNPRYFLSLMAWAQLLLAESKETAQDEKPAPLSAVLNERRKRARELLDEAANVNPLLRPEVDALIELHGL